MNRFSVTQNNHPVHYADNVAGCIHDEIMPPSIYSGIIAFVSYLYLPQPHSPFQAVSHIATMVNLLLCKIDYVRFVAADE